MQLDGTIIAPTSSKAWNSGILQWLEFTKLKDITIQGSGTIEGQGSTWWSSSYLNDNLVNIDHAHEHIVLKRNKIKNI